MAAARRGDDYTIGIRRGDWRERLAALLAERQASEPRARGSALLIEPGAEALAQMLADALPRPVHRLHATETPMPIGAWLEQIAALHEREPLACIAVAGVGDRPEARRAAWRLGPLAEPLWVWIHTPRARACALPALSAHLRRYLEVVDGLAYHEGP
ncbi:MAG: hypothetical protein D6776_06835 [Planctomycetota bacterium]|nr:MAG: hypothetical protein D6776_06835 [Planctomycetota bacterium]